MTNILTFEEAVRLAREALAEKPKGYIYTNEFGLTADQGGISCANWHLTDPEDESSAKVPGCIVGTILHKAGVPLDSMRKHSPFDDVIYAIRGILEVDHEAARFLYACQTKQDHGIPWSEAIAEGIKYVEHNS